MRKIQWTTRLLKTFLMFADGRRKKSTQVCQKSIQLLYSKLCELVKSLAELLCIQVLTDTSILHLSSMGVSPFFAENVSELQLSCLKLVTTVFKFLLIVSQFFNVTFFVDFYKIRNSPTFIAR